jgi:mRNA interferase MazF
LKVTSVIRVGRIAVVEGEVVVGAIGQIATDRLQDIKNRMAEWITGS